MTKREIQFDLLRVVALLAVVFAHAGKSYEDLSGIDLLLTYFCNAIILWHVPCYVMISGRFFLDPDRTVSANKIKKAVLRVICAFVFWNLWYQILFVAGGDYAGLNWKGILFSGALIGPYHFWYLWMLVPLYLLVPFLRKIAEDRKLMEYFIVLFLAAEFLIMYGEYIPFLGETIKVILEKAFIYYPLGYSGYYLLGWYLYKYPLSNPRQKTLYVLGALTLIGGGIFRSNFSDQFVWGNCVFQYLSPNIVIASAAVYIFVVQSCRRWHPSEKLHLMIEKISGVSFGIYLVHVLFIELLSGSFLYSNTSFEIPIRIVRTVLVFLLSYVFTAAIKKIPKLGKMVL